MSSLFLHSSPVYEILMLKLSQTCPLTLSQIMNAHRVIMCPVEIGRVLKQLRYSIILAARELPQVRRQVFSAH